MDITTLFKSRLEIVRNRNKALGLIRSPESSSASSSPGSTGSSPISNSSVKTNTKIFPNKKSKHYAKARELVGNISSLREFLMETRSAYLDVDNNSMNLKINSPRSETSHPFRTNSRNTRSNPSPPDGMTDFEKDQVDMSVQKIVQNTQKRIFEFQNLIEIKGFGQNNPQLYIHFGNVINSISQYLKEVTAIYAEMKAIRVKRSLNFQVISKPLSNVSSVERSRLNTSRRDSTGSRSGGVPRTTFEDEADKSTSNQLFHDEVDPMSSLYLEETNYSPEELQLFEEENSLLLQSLSTVADDVEQIESNVVQIAQLQEIFTENILLQDTQISQISNVVIGTTENIKGGNEQLRQAIQSNADFRAWILFFLIIMSLSLLFLDWYND